VRPCERTAAKSAEARNRTARRNPATGRLSPPSSASGPWRGATSARDDHCAWTSGEESHACGAGGSVLADRFVSSMVSGVGSSVPRVAAPPSYITRWVLPRCETGYCISLYVSRGRGVKRQGLLLTPGLSVPVAAVLLQRGLGRCHVVESYAIAHTFEVRMINL
jgi:hypothetical protein